MCSSIRLPSRIITSAITFQTEQPLIESREIIAVYFTHRSAPSHDNDNNHSLADNDQCDSIIKYAVRSRKISILSVKRAFSSQTDNTATTSTNHMIIKVNTRKPNQIFISHQTLAAAFPLFACVRKRGESKFYD